MRHATFRQLEIFEAIARHGSFTRAAEALYLTQPTVSMQIKKLTDVAGTTLFEQVGKRIVLTEAGQDLAHAARDIFAILERFEMTVAERQGLKRGRLRLVAITTASYFAPRLLGAFCQRYPGIEVSLRVSNREQVLASMADNLDDLYILGQPPEDVDLVALPFMENPLVVIAAPDHPLARGGQASLAQLAAEPWLMREAGSGTRKAIERLFAAHDLEIRPRLELGSNEAIKQAVLAGLGISALSSQALDLHPVGQFAIVPAEHFPIRRHWHVAYPAARTPSPAARSFVAFLMDGASTDRGP
ncbi:MAG: LysR substrate-binding domain-containing protein [Rhodocyclaceae bacterium]